MRSIPKSSLRVLIADDSVTICKLIAQLLNRERSVHIVGVAATAEGALHLAARWTPDILLLDLHLDELPAHDPISVRVGFLSCVRHIIALSTRTDEREQQLARSYGATRIVNKFWLSEELVPSIVSFECSARLIKPTHKPAHHSVISQPKQTLAGYSQNECLPKLTEKNPISVHKIPKPF
jgi:DNA-binding NarL/FixJ family response regulator